MSNKELKPGSEVRLTDSINNKPSRMTVVEIAPTGIRCQWFTTTEALCEGTFSATRLTLVVTMAEALAND